MKKGICFWFTGLPSSGKTTTAEWLVKTLEVAGQYVTYMDGDNVRNTISNGLGFSEEDRNENVRRVGFVASEIVKHGGVAVCSLISPYRGAREKLRDLMGDSFVEIFVDTPLEVCKQRDVKKLYQRAAEGTIKGLTGVDAPYEPPTSPDIVLDTVKNEPAKNVTLILLASAQKNRDNRKS